MRQHYRAVLWRQQDADLAILQPPVGLDEEAFREIIAAMLVTLPVVQLIDQCVATPQRFGHVRDMLQHSPWICLAMGPQQGGRH